MDSSISVDVQMLSVLSGLVLPLLVGVITKEVANNGLKAAALAFLSAVSGLVVSAQQGNGLVSKEAVLAAAMAWVVGTATHFGLYKPTGVTAAVVEKTSNFGVG